MYTRSRCQIVRVDFSFLKSSQRHAALAANTARNRQHGAPTRRGGAVDWLNPYHILHTSDTRGLHAYTSQRRYVGVVVGTKKATGPEGRSTKMPADGTGASERLSVKCHSGHALLPLEVIRELGDVVNYSESTETKAMLLTAHVLRLLLLPSAGSSLTHSLCGQSVIQRMSVRSLSSSVRQG